jgi:hypothetical protein
VNSTVELGFFYSNTLDIVGFVLEDKSVAAIRCNVSPAEFLHLKNVPIDAQDLLSPGVAKGAEIGLVGVLNCCVGQVAAMPVLNLNVVDLSEEYGLEKAPVQMLK